MLLPSFLLLPALIIPGQSNLEHLRLADVLVLLVASPSNTPRIADSATRVFVADRGARKGQTAIVMSGGPMPPGIREGEGFEYHLVGPGSAGPLPSVEVLGLHYVKVRPDRVDAFERFVRERVHPAVGNLRPDLRILYYRDSRAAGSYVALFALTRASRDKYWPGGADSDELRAAFAPLKPLADELRGYLVEGSYLADPKFAAAVFESREWTDFVLQSLR
jgi:hypothetical protein